MKKRLRLIVGFAAAAVLLQGLALLFLTPGGVEAMYPFSVRLHSEKIDPDSNTYAVYYNTRVEVADADLVVMGIDSAVAESYDLLGHFTRFLKQYNNFSHVFLDFDRVSKKLASGIINETRERTFYSKLSALQNQIGLSSDYCDYLAELFVVNTTMAPARKFDLDSYSAGTDAAEMTRAEQVADVFARSTRSALCVVDSAEFSVESSFTKELEALLPDKKIIFINTVYTENCPSPDTHSILNIPLTGKDASIYFSENSSYDGFYSYYDYITDVFGREDDLTDPLDERYTEYYFVVANGTEPKYAESEEEPAETAAEEEAEG